MGFAKRIVGKFHNFVIMKRTIRFLPPRKRQDLQQLAELIRENVCLLYTSDAADD